jgi:sorbitol-specific phosphotransferase system component IIC
LDAGPFVWRSADVGVTATGFIVYSTGVAFTVVALSKGVFLRGMTTL